MFNISHPQKIIRNENVKTRKWYCLILDFSQFVHEKSQNISRNAMQNTLLSIHILFIQNFCLPTIFAILLYLEVLFRIYLQIFDYYLQVKSFPQ